MFKLAHPNRRDEVVGALHGQIEFDPRCCTELPHIAEPEYLYQMLRARGAGEQAYAMSNNEDLDGRIWPLLDALKKCVGWTTGTILYCFEGQVGYYESDDAGYYLLHRPK